MAMVPPARSFINLLAEKQRRYAVLFTGNTRVSLSLRVFGGGSQKAAFRPMSPKIHSRPVCCTREECTQEKLRRVDLPDRRETVSRLWTRRFSRNFRRCRVNVRWSYELKSTIVRLLVVPTIVTGTL